MRMDDKEFEKIAEKVRSRVISAARGYHLDSETEADIAQDTMLKLWIMRGQLNGEKSVNSMGVTIARHLCIDYLRRRRTVGIEETRISDSRNARPDAELESKENERWLSERLNKLPSTEYAVLHLRQVEHKSAAEIASVIGITPASVATLLARARRRLLNDIREREKFKTITNNTIQP